MTIIESLQEYIGSCPYLRGMKQVSVDELNDRFSSYSIDPMPGSRTVSEDLAGNKVREYPFVLSSMECTADNNERILNQGFYQQFVEWLETETESGRLPVLGDKKNAEKIEATTWGYLFQREDTSDAGIYQINCKLTYEQKGNM